ncbi:MULTISPECIES: hypothetical protein [Enorma]|uniref:hypothetical protein n=1 Tax=Enorma TaxID=1472762 RepID=UPI00036885C5|nr:MULTISPECIES: hypothetical protein [Enorma]
MGNAIKRFFGGIAVVFAVLITLGGCQSGTQGPVGMWYGVDDGGNESTLEIDEDGTWLFNGKYSVNGDWSETDSGTIVLSAAYTSVPLEMEGSGDTRMLVFAGEDPHSGNAAAISSSTFYATEQARDEATD